MYSMQFGFDSSDATNRVGLSNLGNTCYMNSVLQILYNCKQLTFFYLNYPIPVSSSRPPYLSDKFGDLVINLSYDRPNSPFIRPFEVLECVRKVNHTFRGFQQQDAQEFLRAFLYEIHDEIKFNPIRDLQFIPQKISKLRQELRHEGYKIEFMDEENPSLIMDIFQGSLVSTVECLNCNKKSRREETFIDLSVPLVKPARLKGDHSSMPTVSYVPATNSTDLFAHLLNLFIFVLFYIRFIPWKIYDYSKKSLDSVFGVSDLHLTDCLDAFFSEDELTGDNRYLCKRCNASCNGTKSTRLLRAPEVLLIHLKRFRNDLITASKLCTSVSFPLTDLDLSPYLFRKKVDTHNGSELYDLAGIICHLGSSSSCGHYISMAYNHATRSWLEYDDEIVTEIDPATVISCISSAYILIYNKQSSHMNSVRKRTDRLLATPSGPDGYYISKTWLTKLTNFADPGPITTHEFLCPHGLLQPTLFEHRKDHILKIPAELWQYLYDKFGCNDPVVRDLTPCQECSQLIRLLSERREREYQTYLEIKKATSQNDMTLCQVNSVWFNAWFDFVNSSAFKPPGAIDNSKIAETFSAYYNSFQPNVNYVLMSEGCWNYLHSIYSGGPKLMLSTGTPEDESSQSEVDYPVSEEELQPSPAHKYRSKSVDPSDFGDNGDSGLTDTSMTVEMDSWPASEAPNQVAKSASSSAYWSNDEEECGSDKAKEVTVEVDNSKPTEVKTESQNETRRRKGSENGRRYGGKRRDRRAR